MRSPTHTIAPHLGLDLYLVSESACLPLQGASKLEVSRSAVQAAEGIFPKGMTQGADRQALQGSHSQEVLEPQQLQFTAQPSSSNPLSMAARGKVTDFVPMQTPELLGGEEGSTTTSTGTGHTTEAAASPNDAAGLTRGQAGRQTNLHQ